MQLSLTAAGLILMFVSSEWEELLTICSWVFLLASLKACWSVQSRVSDSWTLCVRADTYEAEGGLLKNADFNTDQCSSIAFGVEVEAGAELSAAETCTTPLHLSTKAEQGLKLNHKCELTKFCFVKTSVGRVEKKKSPSLQNAWCSQLNLLFCSFCPWFNYLPVIFL